MNMAMEYGLPGGFARVHANVVTDHLRIPDSDLVAYFLKEAITGIDLGLA